MAEPQTFRLKNYRDSGQYGDLYPPDKGGKAALVDGNYLAEYADSGRASCKEFRCKQKIGAGELRLGDYMASPDEDHFGSGYHWFHPECLWKTFTFKKNALPRITSTKQILDFNDLEEEDQKMLERLISRPARASGPSDAELAAQLPVAAVSPQKPRPGGGPKISYSYDPITGQMTITGNTFDIKDELKSYGAKWNPDAKAWVFYRAAHDGAKKYFALADIPATATTVSFSLEELHDLQAAAAASSSQTQPQSQPQVQRDEKKDDEGQEPEKKKPVKKAATKKAAAKPKAAAKGRGQKRKAGDDDEFGASEESETSFKKRTRKWD